MLGSKIKSFTLLILILLAFHSAQAKMVYGLKDLSTFSFNELNALKNDELSPALNKKLEKSLEKVLLINKEIGHIRKPKFNSERQRNYIKVTHWNINQGYQITNIRKALQGVKPALADDISEEKKQKILEQLKDISQTDIFTLNEVDIGLPRSAYKNILAEFAGAINADYAFATEFYELSPWYMEGADPHKYKGLHGNAIISRYPIKSARVLRLPACYDWFQKEKSKLSHLEKSKRLAAKLTVQEKVDTELRRGGRNVLIAEIQLPNKQFITVATAHLENRCKANCRKKQMDFILTALKNVRNPVIFGGDLNSFEGDMSPTSVRKEIVRKIGDPEFLLKSTVTYFNPYALATNAGTLILNFTRKFKDPTVRHLPVVMQNRAYGLFKTISDFEFSDGTKFDNSGTNELSTYKEGKWSNSNERAGKGFVETFALKRSFRMALFKIDWLFVKPSLDTKHKPNYEPAFGRTFKELNLFYAGQKMSDHHPIALDILFLDPPKQLNL